ncbi:NAD(P)-dependent oxidoreductase [Lachnospiraceae bacterium 54-11]
MKIAIITGATSFIGIHLTERLILEGWKVYAVIRKESNKVALLPESERLKIINFNMNEYRQLGKTIKEACDVYVSLAWNGTRGSGRLDASLQEDNYKYSMMALEAIKEIGCKLVISAGSQAEYGKMQGKIDEEAMCNPDTEYGRWKLRYYEEGMNYCKRYNISFKEPRFFSLYGADDNECTMVLSILKNMIKGLPCEMTQCIQLWDFLYIDDAIDGVYRLMNMECEDGIYNFGSGDIRPLKEFVEEMYKLTGSTSSLMFGAVPYPANGMVNACPDISKLQKQTGWKVNTTFSEGIKKIINYKWDSEGKYI